jgi:hypothetical protein
MLQEINTIISCINWQGIAAIFIVNWFFNRDMKKKLEDMDARMFQLATGKSLQQAILEEKMKEKIRFFELA